MANCMSCGQPLQEGAHFCAQCGAVVKFCPQCGKMIKQDARFCGECGAAVGDPAPAPQAPAYPPPPPAAPAPLQPAASAALLNFSIAPYGGMFGQNTNTIVVDGADVQTLQMGESVAIPIAPGAHTIQLVQVFSSAATLKMGITRKSNVLEFTAAPGIQVSVVAEYGMIRGKFSLSLK